MPLAIPIVISVWLVGGLALLGIGSLVDRLRRQRLADWEDVQRAWWLGWACLVIYLQVWHLFRPIDLTSAVPPLLIGAAGVVVLAPCFNARTLGQSRTWLLGLLALLGITWMALLTEGPIMPYDAGLYHLQTIKWLNAFPVVPGLGNLHGRLAFNSAFFAYAALLNVGPLADQAARLANGLVVLALVLTLVRSTIRLVRNRGQVPARDYLRTFVLLPTLAFVGAQGLANSSPELTIWALQTVLALEVLDLLLQRCGPITRFTAFRVALLATVGTLVKLSFLPFGAACLLVLAWRARRDLPALLVAGITVGVPLVPWILHGIVLSGYPAYPSTLFGMPVDWRVDIVDARSDAAWIAGWARAPGPDALQSLGNWSWLGAWLRLNSFELVPPALLSVVSTIVAVCTWRATHERRAAELLLLVPVAIALAGWFLAAPDPRFAGPLLWLFAAAPALLARHLLTARARLHAVALVTLVGTLPLQILPLARLAYLPIVNLTAEASWSSMPSPVLNTFVTRSGLRIVVPGNTDQAWNAPLPSTPNPDARLVLRCPESLACGFRKDLSPTS